MANLLVEQAKNEPVNCARAQTWQDLSQEKSFSLLAHLLQGLAKALSASKPELNDLIVKYYISVAELNRQKIHVKLFNIQKCYELKVVDEFLLVPLPILGSELTKRAQNMSKHLSEQFYTDVGDLVEKSNLTNYLEGLTKSIKLNLDSTLLKNNQKLDVFFENITSSLVEGAFSEVAINFVNPLAQKTFESMLKKSYKLSIEAFDRRSAQFREKTVAYENKLNKLKMSLMEKAKIFREDNEKSVAAFLKREALKFLQDIDRLSSHSKKNFPMDFDQLKTLLKTEIDRLQATFVKDLASYSEYEAYKAALIGFHTELVKIAEVRKNENFQAYMVAVETPLKFAKKSIMLSVDRYNTLFAFKKFVISSCMLHLDDGKAKDWPPKLKVDIIELFIQDDDELRYQFEARQRWWSRIVGFFQWLWSLLFG